MKKIKAITFEWTGSSSYCKHFRWVSLSSEYICVQGVWLANRYSCTFNYFVYRYMVHNAIICVGFVFEIERCECCWANLFESDILKLSLLEVTQSEKGNQYGWRKYKDFALCRWFVSSPSPATREVMAKEMRTCCVHVTKVHAKT